MDGSDLTRTLTWVAAPGARAALAGYLAATDGPAARRRLDRLMREYAAPAVAAALAPAGRGPAPARWQTQEEADAEDACGEAIASLLTLLGRWRSERCAAHGAGERGEE